MTKRLASILVLISMALAFTIALVLNDPRDAEATSAEQAAPIECHVEKNPPKVVCVQDGIIIISNLLNIPTATVTLPVPTLIPTSLPTITLPPLPGVTRTVTKTIRPNPVVIPGPTKTVPVPGPTKTVKVPGPKVTVTRQAVPDDGIVEPDDGVNIGDGDLSPKEKKIISILSIVTAAVVAGVLFLWLGFILGYRSADRENKRFWSAMRQQLFNK